MSQYNEIKNFLTYFFLRKNFLTDIKFYFSLIFRKLFYKIVKKFYYYYPKNIRDELKKFQHDNNINFKYPKKNKKLRKIEFYVINKKLTYVNSKIWRMTFEDPK